MLDLQSSNREDNHLANKRFGIREEGNKLWNRFPRLHFSQSFDGQPSDEEIRVF
jgi:hypothetical protein